MKGRTRDRHNHKQQLSRVFSAFDNWATRWCVNLLAFALLRQGEGEDKKPGMQTRNVAETKGKCLHRGRGSAAIRTAYYRPGWCRQFH